MPKEHVDFILAVGGGSVIDSSKAIGYGVANPNNDVWDFCLKKLFQPAVCPLVSSLQLQLPEVK